MTIKLWNDLGKNLNLEVPWVKAVQVSSDSAKTILDIAKVLKTNADKEELAPLIGRLGSLLDVLANPIADVVGAAIPFSSVAVGLVQVICQSKKGTTSIEDCVSIIGQAAYVKSWNTFFEEYSSYYPDIDIDRRASKGISQDIKKIGEIELTEKEAERVIICFHESVLAQKFNPLLLSRLKDSGLEEEAAKIAVERISRNTYRYLKKMLSSSKQALSQITAVYGNNWEQDLQYQDSLDEYLHNQISPDTVLEEQKNRWQVFDENFIIKDIYVPLEAQPLDSSGKPASNQGRVILESWAKDFLVSSNNNKKVLFIQAAPGRGKTAFCKMFAEWLREYMAPIWTPILIRLRDISSLNTSLEVILKSTVNTRFSQDEQWLHNPNMRFLFILDGFDELLMEGRTSRGLRAFLEKVDQFHRACQTNSEMQHRFLVTGRSLALQDVQQYLSSNFSRINILPMSKELQERWLFRWKSQVGLQQANAFRDFLSSPNVPISIVGGNETSGLAQEPLILYLLAAMHRDGRLSELMFSDVERDQAKVLIYEQSLEWAINRERKLKEASNDFVQNHTMLDIHDIRRILQEAGLCVIQSGGEWTSTEMVRSRLQDDEGAKAFLEEATEELGESPLRNAFVSCYLQSSSGNKKEGGIEFVHKSFGEFLCAERIKEAFEIWTKPGDLRNIKFYVRKNRLQDELYDLFGFGCMPPEVITFLFNLINVELTKARKNGVYEEAIARYNTLFERLYLFFWDWCRGHFINGNIENSPFNTRESIPLRIAQRLDSIIPVSVGQLQVDVYTGINVLIILMKLHQNVPDIDFDLCKDPVSEELTPKTLSKLISYVNVLGSSVFVELVGKYLNQAQLEKANLRRVNLGGAKLMDSKLTDADLCRADMTRADLRGASMHGTYLRGADLEGTNLGNAKLNNSDLCRAYLHNTDLSSANLSQASIRGANLDGADLEKAILRDISWDTATQWFCCEGIHLAREIPPELDADEDFKDAKELSRLLADLQNAQSIDEVSKNWMKRAKRIKKRRGSLVYAKVLNKFAWRSCLYGFSGQAIVNMAKAAVNNNPKSGNYKDTLAVAIAIHYDNTNVGLHPENLETNETIYRSSIQYLNKALESKDFRMLSRRTAKTIRDRREHWIEELEQSRNPFTTEILELLLREER
ncbi:MAG: pentapeptide repeat-containing protein [Cyanobacteria bacterium P01_D01_bin.36]